MRHEKEWHTCDRCGAEIKEMPSEKRFLYRKLMPKSEFIMRYGEAYGYISDFQIVSDEIMGVHIVEAVSERTKAFDLCPKCRKDFERFMRYGKSTDNG